MTETAEQRIKRARHDHNPMMEDALKSQIGAWFEATDASSGNKLDDGGTTTIEFIKSTSTKRSARVARGTFGEIKLALSIRSSGTPDSSPSIQLVAVKTIEQASQAQQQQRSTFGGLGSFSSPASPSKPKLNPDVFHEICALRRLGKRCNTISPLLGLFVPSSSASSTSAAAPSGNNGTALSMVFPYCPIDLYESIRWRQQGRQHQGRKQYTPVLSWNVIRQIAHDMISAALFCHQAGIIHCDIKPNNFLVAANGTIQLCDFGLARPYNAHNSDGNSNGHDVPHDAEPSKAMCAVQYRSPEMLLGSHHKTPAMDVFGLGWILLEVIASRCIYASNASVLDQLSLVFDVLGTPTDATWPDVATVTPDYTKFQFANKSPQSLESIVPRVVEDARMLRLLNTMIRLDPKQRISCTQAIEHEAFAVMEPETSIRRQIRDELIPDQLRSPLMLLSSQINDCDDKHKCEIALAKHKAIQVATNRRNFLKQSAWTKAIPKSDEQCS